MAKLTKEHDLDIVLVCADRATFARAQRWRLKQENCWEGLTDHHRAIGEELADYAKKGKLALFLGAGVSIGAGLPSWDALLDNVRHITILCC